MVHVVTAITFRGGQHPGAVTVLHEAVRLAGTLAERANVARPAARVLGLWGHPDGVIAICQDALAGHHDQPVLDQPVLGSTVLDDTVTDSLEAELFQSELSSAALAGQAMARAQPWLSRRSAAWRVNDAFVATLTGRPVQALMLDGDHPRRRAADARGDLRAAGLAAEVRQELLAVGARGSLPRALNP